MTSLLSYFDTEADAPSSRRDALGTVGKLGLGAAIAAIPFLDPRAAYAQGAGPNQVDIDGNGTCDSHDIDTITQRVIDGLATPAERMLLIQRASPAGLNS